MRFPSWLVALSSLLFLFACPIRLHAYEPTSKPNFVFLLIDDLRWNALGFMGDKIVQTPHMDRLAEQGVVFVNCFVTTSICAVSRASILTGQWERRHGIDNFAKGLNGAAWENTYPALLRAQGYRTGFIGKFGVGNEKEVQAKATAFDYWRGMPGQAGMFYEKGDPVHKTARFGDQALEFLAECKPEKPFCLSISFNAVHARDAQPREFMPDRRDEGLYADLVIPLPKLATPEAFDRLAPFVQQSEGRRRWGWRFDSETKAQVILKDYYRLITGVDREVGRIVETLQQRGFAENTVLIITSDNGFALGDRGLADKWFMYEEDIRVPLLIFDPRAASDQRGKRSQAMVLNVDLAPTLLDLASISIPSTIQGKSLLPLLTSSESPPSNWRTEFYYEHHSVPDRIPLSEGVRTERHSYIRWVATQPVREELYDLEEDPLQEKNLAADPDAESLLATLRTRWQEHREGLK